MVNIANKIESAPDLHDDHEVSCVAFQSLVFRSPLPNWPSGLRSGRDGSGWPFLSCSLLPTSCTAFSLVITKLLTASSERAAASMNSMAFSLACSVCFRSAFTGSCTNASHASCERKRHRALALRSDQRPRWARCLAAFFELTLGLFYSPLIFLRVFVQRHSLVRSRKVRRRIWLELALTVVAWTIALATIAFFGAWRYFFWIYLIPGLIAANLQSWRKYIEHLGLTGNTVNSSTRTIVPKSWLGWSFCLHPAPRTISRGAP